MILPSTKTDLRAGATVVILTFPPKREKRVGGRGRARSREGKGATHEFWRSLSFAQAPKMKSPPDRDIRLQLLCSAFCTVQ